MRLLLVVAIFFVVPCHAQEINTSEFAKADSIVQLYPDHSIINLEILSHKLTDDLETQEGKFRSIFKWICSNISNDYVLAESNRRKRERLTGQELVAWNSKLTLMVQSKLMNSHATVCTGYAWLIREMSAYAGITSVMVDGYGRNAQSNIGKSSLNHTWNAVQLNGKWFLCDATWSSGAVNTVNGEYIKRFDEAYFLPDPDYFIRNHYPLDVKWSLLEQPPTLVEFINRPLTYAGIFHHKVLPLTPQQFEIKVVRGETVSFHFDNPASKAIVLLVGSKKVNATSYKFKRRGIYAVHVMTDGTPLFSYKVTVS
ncbi:MAG TPA: hypothetical protein VFE50_01610 [Cyclobacteriaceae bacterium]|nr:hypothetical protein [Cyclobacteriaceae bacterium]